MVIELVLLELPTVIRLFPLVVVEEVPLEPLPLSPLAATAFTVAILAFLGPGVPLAAFTVAIPAFAA